MGGHGGLNILPQKRWNVYNRDNREKVRRDEEAAAREEYIKQQQALKTEAESRLEKLRTSKRKHDSAFSPQHEPSSSNKEEDGCAVNLDVLDTWETLVGKSEKASDVAEWKVDKEIKREAARTQKMKKKDEETRAMMPGDEKSRLGYGLVGKDVKKPWYLSKTDYKNTQPEEDRRDDKKSPNGEKSHKKKSLQELREERLKREQQEREKAKKLLLSNGSLNQGTSKSKYSADGHRHIPYYNSGYGHARC